MDETSKRNFEAVKQALQGATSKICEQQTRIDGLVTTISSFAERLNGMEQQLYAMRALLAGRGPTG